KSAIFACKIDSDCVAVEKVGCCHNGYLEAVNKDQKEKYLHSFVCTEQIMCPQFLVHDTRLAQCNLGTNKCEMVEIDKISCGGFTRNPHGCPAGYDCVMTRHVPDAPGVCQ